MQENAPEWVPIYELHVAWETRLVVFYLLIVCGFLAFRSAFRFVGRRIVAAELTTSRLDKGNHRFIGWRY